MINSFKLKYVFIALAALLLSGFIGYSLRGSTPSSTILKSAPAAVTATQSTSATSSSSQTSSNLNLKNRCTTGLQNYGTSVRTKAEAMAAQIRTQATSDGTKADAGQYQPQIDQLLAYLKTMQANMAALQNCITQADQNHDFNASELSNINAAIDASQN